MPQALSRFMILGQQSAAEQPAAAEPGNAAPVPADLTAEATAQTIQESLESIWTSMLERMPFIMAGVVICVITWLLAKLAHYAVSRVTNGSRLNTSFKELVRQLASITVWVIGLMVAAIVVFPGMTPAKILTVLGLGSIAIGFAFKDIVENFFAGVLILWKFPFDPGDFIVCGDVEGRVEDISIRMTQIRQTDGQLVVLPNAMLFKDVVRVMTDWDTRRITVIVGVAYDEDVDASREVIQEVVAKCKTVHSDHDVEVYAQEFADSSVNFEVTWWTGPTPKAVRQSRDEVVAAVKRALDDAEIEIPFPYRTLTFKDAGSPEGKERLVQRGQPQRT